jgi:hypothetical protein
MKSTSSTKLAHDVRCYDVRDVAVLTGLTELGRQRELDEHANDILR